MHYIKPGFLAALFALASQPLNAETNTFVGIETVKINTTFDYASGSEDYSFSGQRIKYGVQFSDGGIIGIELLTGDSDDTFDASNTPYRLETDTAIGLFVNIGQPYYLKLGWSFWDTEYTDLNLDVVDQEVLSSFEFGLGFRFALGSNLKAYGDLSKRISNANYPDQFTDGNEIEYDSVLFSLGLSATF
ncbi:MAG: porin family protein [Gammaproteobacteria bacterium]|nr:porin family protein [Gammaproteobacteria bacterium]